MKQNEWVVTEIISNPFSQGYDGKVDLKFSVIIGLPQEDLCDAKPKPVSRKFDQIVVV